MVSAMQTLVAVVNKHGCQHAAADSVTYDEGIACGEITNDKMRPFLKNISHDPNARHLIPKNPAEEERLYNSNPAYKKASDEHDEFSEAFQAVYPIRGGRIGSLKKGKLTDLGYHPSRKATSRHRALSKAVQKYGRTSTLRKVNAVAVLTKRRAPVTSRKYRADVKYLQKRYF